MMNSKTMIFRALLGTALFVTTHVWGVDSYWTGSGADNLFDNPDNWANGVPDGWFAVDPSQQSFSKYLMGLGKSIKNLSGAVYFNNGEEEFSVSADEGGGFSVSGNMYIGESGKTGDVCFNSGTYKANDISLSPSDVNGKSTLTINGATVLVGYWMYTSYGASSTSDIKLIKGSLETGVNETGNGNFYLCRGEGSIGTVDQSSGNFVVRPRSNNSGSDPYGMVLGLGARSKATYTKTGGELNVVGALRIGYGASSTATLVQKSEGEGNTITTTENFDIGVASGANGFVAISNGTVNCEKSFNVAVSGGTGKFILAGGTVDVHKCSYWAADANSTSEVEISGGILNFTGTAGLDDWGSLRILNGSDSTFLMNINGGTVNLDGDMQLGAGSSGNAEINISNGGVLCCGSSLERWFKIGYGSGSKSTVNLQTGGLLDIWYMDHPSTGPSTLKFEGGTLRAKKATDNLINDDNDRSFSVVIGDNGGYIDTQNHDVIIKKTMSGTGTLTKKGTGALTLTGSYGGGLAVAADSGTVTTPGNQTLSAGQNVFLISKGVSELTAAQAATLAGDHPIWFESTGRIDLKDCILDFSSATEQLLFAASSMTIDGTPVAADTDVSTHIHVLNATAAHKVVFKSGGIYAVADLTENKWIGEAPGDWSDPGNWSEGVPAASSYVVFEGDAVVLFSENTSAKRWLKLRLEDNATVEFRNTDDSHYPGCVIDTGSIEGTGTIILTHCGFYASSDVEIPSTIKIVIKNSTSTTNNGYNCWLSAADGQSLTVGGTVEVQNYLSTDGTVIFNGDITVAAGARLNITSGTTTFNAVLTCQGAAVLEKAGSAAVAAGQSAQFTEQLGISHVDAAIAARFGVDTSVNIWRGGATGDWSEKTNWHYGVPTSNQTAKFEQSVRVIVADNDNHEVNEIVIADACKVTVGPEDKVDNWPRLYLVKFEGPGTLELRRVGLYNQNGTTAVLSGPIEFSYNGTRDNWVEVNGGSLTLSGNITMNDPGPDAGDNERLFINNNVTISGNISGSGRINIKEGATLSGDNRGFQGTIYKTGSNRCYIDGVNAAGTNTIWDIKGDMQVRNVKSGDTIKFGALNLANDVYCVMYFPKDTPVTIEVGARNVDMSLGDNYWFWAEGETSDCNLTIKKVGTGTLTSHVYNYKSVDVAQGAVILNNPTGALNTKSFTEIESVSVASGAVLGGNVGSTAGKLTISSLTLNPGAIVSQTVTENSGSYSCPTLTVNGSVDASGVKAKIANADFITDIMSGSDESAKTALKGTTFTLLSATSMTGTPNPAVDGLGSEGINCYAVAQNNAMKILFGGSYSVEVADGSTQSVQITDPGLAAWLMTNSATEYVNTANGNGVTGILAYMLGAETYEDATKPTMGATVADGVATLTFDDSAFRRVPGLKLAYYLESCDKADFSEAVTTSAASDEPTVQVEFANAKIFNRLCADVRASE